MRGDQVPTSGQKECGEPLESEGRDSALPWSLTAAAALAVSFWVRGLVAVGLPRDAFVAAGVAVSVSLIVVVAWGSLRRATVTHRLDIRQFRTRGGRRRFAVWFLGGLAVGLLYGCAVALAGGFAGGQVAELADGIAFGFGGGTVFGVSLGFAFGLSTRPDAISRPGQLVSEGVANSAARLGVGLTAGLALGLGGGLAQGLVFGPLLALVAISTSPWPRYGLACILLAVRRDSPCQMAKFLDWACESGLMRVAGPAVQFRHREFQAWLGRPA